MQEMMIKCKHCDIDFERFGKKIYCSPKCKKEVAYNAHKAKRKQGLIEGILYGRPIIEHYFVQYKKRAKDKNIRFLIDLTYFSTFWNKPCSYCGSSIPTIGIDRVNNTEGYTIGNLVSCCTKCNMSKRGMTGEQWIQLCKKVSDNHTFKAFS